MNVPIKDLSTQAETYLNIGDSKQIQKLLESKKKYSICLTTDFVAPKWGGVETHGYQLASCLIERGHKVIMISSMYRHVREGIRVMGNGLKVYHLPLRPYYNNDVALIAIFNIIPILRQIFIREHVDLCHSHLTTSITGAMVLVVAKSMGLKTCMTEHSHFTYNELDFISLNKIIKWYLKDIDAGIAVSHACKDNFSLRAKISPAIIYTIPNAVDTEKFQPKPSLRFPLKTINIVCVSRLAQKKGIDMLIDIIPDVLAKHPNAYFIIGGDGPKFALL